MSAAPDPTPVPSGTAPPSPPPGRAGAPRWPALLTWAVLAAVLLGLGAAALPACGIGWPGGRVLLDFCPAAAAPAADVADAGLDAERAREPVLRNRLDQLRRRAIEARAACLPPAAPPPRPAEHAEAVPATPPEPAPAAVPPELPPAATRPPAPPPPEAPLPGRRPDPPPANEPPPIRQEPPDDRLRIPETAAPNNAPDFLEGCWRTDPFRHEVRQPQPGISEYCFDARGNGTLVYSLGNRTCRAPAHGRITPDRRLVIEDADTTCSDGSPWWQDRLVCVPDAGAVAVCSGRSDSDSGPQQWRVNLHRR